MAHFKVKVGTRVITPQGVGTVVQNLGGRWPWLVEHDSGYFEQYKQSDFRRPSDVEDEEEPSRNVKGQSRE